MELFDYYDNELRFVPPGGMENGSGESAHNGCVLGIENKGTALKSLEDNQQLPFQDDCDTGRWEELPPPSSYDPIPVTEVVLEALPAPIIPGAQKKRVASIDNHSRRESVDVPPRPYDRVARPESKPVQFRAPKVHGAHKETIIAIYRRLRSENEDEKICDIAFRVEQEIKAYHPYDPLARFIHREFNWNGNYVTYIYNHHAEWDE